IANTFKRMKKVSKFTCAIVTAALSLDLLNGCASHNAPHSQPPVQAQTGIRWISLSDLEYSLPSAPVHVVFDVDDTALFTSGGFQWGTRTYGKDIVSAGVSVREEDLPTPEAKAK